MMFGSWLDPRIPELIERIEKLEDRLHDLDINERLRVMSDHWRGVLEILRKIEQKLP